MDHARCQTCPTRRVCLAAGLESHALSALAECVLACPPMNRGDYLYRARDPARHCGSSGRQNR